MEHIKENNMKTNCKDCIACVPNEEVASRSIFAFPEDYECLMLENNFPNLAYLCVFFINGDPIWKN
jgi:hypothetical protein